MWYLSPHVRLHKTEIYICIVSCSWKIPFKKVPQYSGMRKNITTMKEKDGNDQWRNQVFSLKRRCQSHFLQPPSLEILLKIKNVAPFGSTNEENVVCLSSLTSIIVVIEFVSGLSNRVLQKVI